MKIAAIIFAAFSLGLCSPVLGCSIHRAAVTQGPQEPVGNFELYRVRIINALVQRGQSDLDILALEAVVLGSDGGHREGSLVRLIMPDRWQACYDLYSEDVLNGAGQVEGYVLLRRDEQTGFLEVAFGRSDRNRQRMLRFSSSLEWKSVRFQ